MLADLLAGKRRVGTIATITVPANAGAVALMTLSTFAGMQGVKSMILRRLKVANQAGNTFVHIGTGLAGAVVDAMVPIYSIVNTTDDYEEGDLPGIEFTGTLMVYADALPAGNITVQAEVEKEARR